MRSWPMTGDDGKPIGKAGDGAEAQYLSKPPHPLPLSLTGRGEYIPF